MMILGNWLWPLRRRQLLSAASPSLKIMASEVLLERHPLERTVRWRTVANELSMTLVVRRCFPVLGREVVEGEQRVAILDSFLVSAIQISCSARLAFDCWLFGSLLRTLAVLCTQQRWPRVLGHTSSIACQKPSPPSAIASSGPIASPRRFKSRRSSFQDCALSRTPSIRPTSSFLPSGA